MKVELHLHTSRYSACAVNTPEQILSRLLDCGYDAVFITEHDAVWDDNELKDIQEAFPEIRVFSGVELTIEADYFAHLLVLGTNDPSYLDLYAEPAAVLERARDAGHLTVLAHPFRWEGGDAMLRAGLLPDAIEARTANQTGQAVFRARSEAARLGLLVVNAGDIHSVEMIDQAWIETDRPLTSGSQLRDIVRSCAYRNGPPAGISQP